MDAMVTFCQLFENGLMFLIANYNFACALVAVPKFTMNLVIWLTVFDLVFAALFHERTLQLAYCSWILAFSLYALYNLYAAENCDPGVIPPKPADPEIRDIIEALRGRGHLGVLRFAGSRVGRSIVVVRRAKRFRDQSAESQIHCYLQAKNREKSIAWRATSGGHPGTGCCIALNNLQYFFFFVFCVVVLSTSSFIQCLYCIFLMDDLSIWLKLLQSVHAMAMVPIVLGIFMLFNQIAQALARDMTSREMKKTAGMGVPGGFRKFIKALRFYLRQPYKPKTRTTTKVGGVNIDKANLKPGTVVDFNDDNGAPMQLVTFSFKDVQKAIADAGVTLDADGKPRLGSNMASLEVRQRQLAELKTGDEK